MKSKLFLLLVVALTALMLVAAGCGDDEETGGGAGGGATTTTESSGGGSTGNAQADEAVQAAIESCKTSIQAVPNLQDDTKADLEKICEDAGSGDAEAVKQATKEVCEKIVEDTVPAGASQDQAKQACAAAGG